MSNKTLHTTLTLKEMLSYAWTIWKTHLKTIAIITAIIYIPINAVLFYVPSADASVEGLQSYMRAMRLLEFFIGIVVTMAISHITFQFIEHKKTLSVQEAFQAAFSRYFSALGTQLLLGVFLVGLILLLVVPGIYFGVLWSFALYAVIFREKVFKGALDYSYEIVKGRWWYTAGIFVAIALLAIVAGFIIGLFSWIFPNTMVTTVIVDTLVDIASTYFIVWQTVFFLNMEATKGKKEDTE